MTPATRRRSTAAPILLFILLASLFPCAAASVETEVFPIEVCCLERPIPFEQTIMSADAIAIGVVRPDEDRFGRRTVDVIRWIAPGYSMPSTIFVGGGYASSGRVGARTLWVLRVPGYTTRVEKPADYTASWVIDLADGRQVNRALQEFESPWRPWLASLSSTTSQSLNEWWGVPLKVPAADPRLAKVERILNDAWEHLGEPPGTE